MNTFAPFARPMYIMAKPAGSLCNLACHYCYYLEKAKLYQDNPRQIMTVNYWKSLSKNISKVRLCHKSSSPGMVEKH